jgi:prepilin-type N-terminal cleavage/methylation domain-containing protein
MLARIQMSIKEKDEGFTLIELLVVIIIIGILAAIAIPVFLNQRKKAVDASMKSDLRSAANEMESLYVDNQTYPASAAGSNVTAVLPILKLSTGNVVTFVEANTLTTTAYCMKAANPKGSNPAAGLVYDSDQGGLQPAGTACS